MAGYIRPDNFLQWLRMGEMIDGSSPKYTLEYTDGMYVAQNGGVGRVRSRVIYLVIAEPEPVDSGVYTCQIMGTNVSTEVNLTVSEVKGMCWYKFGLWL